MCEKNNSAQINQHVQSKKHKQRWKEANPDPTNHQALQAVLKLIKTTNTAATEADILSPFTIPEDWSFDSCDHLMVFLRMFCGSVAKKFSMGHNKVSYSISMELALLCPEFF